MFIRWPVCALPALPSAPAISSELTGAPRAPKLAPAGGQSGPDRQKGTGRVSSPAEPEAGDTGVHGACRLTEPETHGRLDDGRAAGFSAHIRGKCSIMWRCFNLPGATHGVQNGRGLQTSWLVDLW